VSLPKEVDDLIVQENARRNTLFRRIYNQGPIFNSTNYGVLSFNANGSFSWTGFDMLVPLIIPDSVQGTGRTVMGLFLDSSLENRYDGAFSLYFNGAGNAVNFLYTVDSEGLRIEYVPQTLVEGVTVIRRDASPTVIYFFRGEGSQVSEEY
jgi:hypothetical protein